MSHETNHACRVNVNLNNEVMMWRDGSIIALHCAVYYTVKIKRKLTQNIQCTHAWTSSNSQEIKQGIRSVVLVFTLTSRLCPKKKLISTVTLCSIKLKRKYKLHTRIHHSSHFHFNIYTSFFIFKN